MLKKKINRNDFSVIVRDFSEVDSLDEFDWVLPLNCSDTEYLNERFPTERGFKFLAPSDDTMRLAHNKIEFNRYLQEQGFAEFVPTLECREYPFVLKRAEDAGGIHSFLIETESDWNNYRNHASSSEYFTQTYVPGDTEFTTHIFAGPDHFKTITVRFRMNRQRYIRGARMQPFRNVDIDLVTSPFTKLFASILTPLGFRGFGCFNYKVLDGVPMIFEFNPRIGGSAHWGINELLSPLTIELATRQKTMDETENWLFSPPETARPFTA